MVHAFLTVAMQVLHTPDPSEAIAGGPCSCWMYSTLFLRCHHLCPSVRMASGQFICQAEPSTWALDSELVCLIRSGWQHAMSSSTDLLCMSLLLKGIGAGPRSVQLCL